MDSISVLNCCLLSFLAVFVLLSVLAIVIRLMTAIFPEKEAETDLAVVAAIHSAVAAQIPGAQVTSIEEIEK
jgi:hypothetical protein